jgi:catechol-2,3-dioxygenase
MEGTQHKPSFAMLRDDNGMVLTLIRAGRSQEVEYPGTFHIGFIQPSEEAVNEINRRLKEDGFDVPPPARLHGSWTFYFRAPGGFAIEVLG